jgi:hypothetical protein
MAKKIGTLAQAERLVPSLVRALQHDSLLAQRALANPLLAVEELGYEFAPEVRAAAERRLRFPPATSGRLQALSEEIQQFAGHPFDLDSPADLDAVLFGELGLRRPRGRIARQLPPDQLPPGTDFSQAAAPLPWQGPFTPKVIDPLKALKGRHPIVDPLLEYRALDSSEPRLAPAEVYEKLRSGEVTIPIGAVRFRLQQGVGRQVSRQGTEPGSRS